MVDLAKEETVGECMIAAKGEHRAAGSLQCSPDVMDQRLPMKLSNHNGLLDDHDGDTADKGPKDFAQRAI